MKVSTVAERASRLGEVVGYLDDGSFSARPGALACAHEAYSDECATRNWQVVERKSLMTGELHEGKVAHPLYATAAEGGAATGVAPGDSGGAEPERPLARKVPPRCRST